MGQAGGASGTQPVPPLEPVISPLAPPEGGPVSIHPLVPDRTSRLFRLSRDVGGCMRAVMPRAPKPEEPDKPEKTFVPSKHVQKLIDSVFGKETNRTKPKGAPPPEVAAAVFRTKLNLYLEGLAQGLSHTSACRAANLSPRSVQELLSTDKDFAQDVTEAYASGTDYFEDLAAIRAHYSDQILIRLLEARRPERYRAKQGSSSTPVIVNVAPLFPVDQAAQPKKMIDVTPEKQHDEKEARDAPGAGGGDASGGGPGRGDASRGQHGGRE